MKFVAGSGEYQVSNRKKEMWSKKYGMSDVKDEMWHWKSTFKALNR